MATVLSQKTEGTYTFASQPRAIQQRKKYREEIETNDGVINYGNIMYDRRIKRGCAYAQTTLPASAQPDPIEIQRQQEQRRRALARKRAKQQLRPQSPGPVKGRKHMDVQTELYLEELSDRVEEADVECQTDAFLDRPPSPLFIPACTGVSVATQINEGDLFDFDIEVKPMLEVLIGKTIEQSLLEVMEEDELANLRAQQRAFQELRNAELVEQQRLEEQERRHREEKERRKKQQRELLRLQQETSDKIAARAFAQSYLSDLVPSVFGTLSDNGYFFDPVERDVEQGFLPWLVDCVDEELNKKMLGRVMLDAIIREVVTKRHARLNNLAEEDAKSETDPDLPKVSLEVPEPPADTAVAAEVPEVAAEPEQAAQEPEEQAATQEPAEEGEGQQQEEEQEGEVEQTEAGQEPEQAEEEE